jgi:hypothetical protein
MHPLSAAIRHVNNSWLPGEQTLNTVFVFVHGVLSDSEACWRNETTGAFWPEMVQEDFRGVGVFLGGYYTRYTSGDYAVRDCAQELFTYLSQPLEDKPAVLQHERLVFVCHSLGGIVVRYMLEAWRQAFQLQAIDLVLVASPSLGSKYAVWLESLIDALEHETGKQLAWQAPLIEDLDGRFKDLKEKKLIPRLMGHEFREQKSLIPGLPPIVSGESAARYFGSPTTIPDSDHSSIVKPPGKKARIHVELLAQYREFNNTFPSVVPLPPPAAASQAVPPRAVLECRSLTWSLRINASGDGYNQLAFEGVTAARSVAGAVYRLPPASVERGSLSGYLLDRSKTSPHVRLKSEQAGERKVEAAVHFEQTPSLENPQKLLLQMLDFEAYALDQAELSGEDLDYAEKTIRGEQIDDFIIEVSFPDSMSLSLENPPYPEVHQIFPSDSEEGRAIFDEALTRRAVAGFHFSVLSRTAYLRVSKPPQNSLYRVCWRLGDPLAGGTRTAQLARLEIRRKVFLSIRDLFSAKIYAPDPDNGRDNRDTLLRQLAAFGSHVADLLRKELNAPEVDKVISALEEDLEINLMAWDSRAEALRFVAGTNIGTVWNSQLKVGQGIAGQAAQWLRARYFDDERARNTPVAEEYVVLDGSRRHAWLLAIPLWMEDSGGRTIGILNIGTFDASFGRILRVLQKTELMTGLQLKANGDLLPGILRIMVS